MLNDPINYFDPVGHSQAQINNALDWIRANHPELLKDIDPIVSDSVLGNLTGGDGFTLGQRVWINTNGLTDAEVVGMVAHELYHAKKGFWKTVFGPDEHDNIVYPMHADILDEYEKSLKTKKGNRCP